MVHKFFPNQIDLNKVIKLRERRVFKKSHLPMAMKEIQAGYLASPYFKSIYSYLAQTTFFSSKTTVRQVETQVEIHLLLDLSF